MTEYTKELIEMLWERMMDENTPDDEKLAAAERLLEVAPVEVWNEQQ